MQTHPNSTKVYIGQHRVPMREIALSGGEPPLQLYETSGLNRIGWEVEPPRGTMFVRDSRRSAVNGF